jgi:hypothetical protein
MTKTQIPLVFCAAALLSSAAFADTVAEKDRQRDVNQQQRIQNGMENGSLTNREASRLEAGQARTDRKVANAAADGRMGAVEQGRIRRSENRQSANVYGKKHNARTK